MCEEKPSKPKCPKCEEELERVKIFPAGGYEIAMCPHCNTFLSVMKI